MNRPETDFISFAAAVSANGLGARHCHAGHWQIKGGSQCRLVNCWPNTRQGFRYQAAPGNLPVRTGTVAEAIRVAGPRPVEADPPGDEDTEAVSQSIGDRQTPRVGLIRRLWRWLW